MCVNVVVVVLDTTRGRDAVPADPSLTPTLASIAESGTEFTNAFAAAPWTLPSHASLFTGTYPSTHEAHGNAPILDDQLPTLAKLFRDAGYETAAVSNNAWIAEEFGFDRGFDTFREYSELSTDEGTMDALDGVTGTDRLRSVFRNTPVADAWRRLRGRLSSRTDDGADRTVAEVRQWLDGRTGEEPFFLFVNCIEPHLEYRPPREYAERHLPDGWSYERAMALRQDPREYDVGKFDHSESEWAALHGLYRAEIEYLDERVGRIRAALREAGEWEDTVFAVTGDHGENIGDHGILGHQYGLYDSVLHVPLVIHGGPFDGGGESDALVQHTDLPPTLLDAAGVSALSARERFQGRSLHPSAGAPSRSTAYAEYHAPPITADRLAEKYGDVPEWIRDRQGPMRAVRTRQYKYIRGAEGIEELYELSRDPTESSNVAGDAPRAKARLESELEERRPSATGSVRSESVSVSASTEQRLADLGYR